MSARGSCSSTARRCAPFVWWVACCFAIPAAAQTLGHGVDDGISTWRVVLALLLCLALAVAIPFVLKTRLGGLRFPRLSIPHQGRRLQVIESVRLNQHADLCLVRLDEAQFLVSVSSSGVRVIRGIPVQAVPPSPGGRE